ncbi:MAG: hypothetical protein IT164_16445 [Bryobacterales bacterium]|nr:hypothetical protein [Bryobacterales bacterium]
MKLRRVTIIVTNLVIGSYEARSYPDEQKDASGQFPLYSVPVYTIRVRGTDDAGNPVLKDFMAPRFMPYYNKPASPVPHYAAKGWVNAGLSSARTVIVPRFIQDYEVQNRYSPGRGAIVVKDSFYIHAGPADLKDAGFGSAGCIEIVGDFDVFKKTIADLSGAKALKVTQAIQQLVAAGKLVVEIQEAKAPDIKKSSTRNVKWAP